MISASHDADWGEVGGGLEQSFGLHVGDLRGRDVLDVAAALVDGGGLPGVNIEPEHLVAVPIEVERERQADVTEAEDTDACGFVLDFFEGGHEGWISDL